MRAELKDLEEFIKKRKVQVVDYLQKAEDGKRDKLELFRDLATYEFNFSKLSKNKTFTVIDSLTDRIEDFKACQASLIESSGGINGWLSPSQVDDLSYDAQLIRII